MKNIGITGVKALKYIVISIFTILFCSAVQGHIQADINSDGVVDFYDFSILADGWLQRSVTPMLVLKAVFPSLGLVRDSVAYDADFRELPENVSRYEDICVASRPTVWVNTDVGRLVHDVDGDLIICSWYRPVFTTTDGVEFTELFNIATDEDFVGYYESGDDIRSVKVMPDGSWMLSFGQYATSGPAHTGHLFRSVDKGLTWTHVLEFESGYAPYWGWCAISDNEVAIGEYGFRDQSDNPRRVFYSDDYGTTWSKIWEPEPALEEHVHFVAFAPNNTDVMYISYGDRFSNRVEKIVYTLGEGGKRNIANWSKAANSPVLGQGNNPVYALSDGEYLYLGADGGWTPTIYRLDPEDDSATSVLDCLYPTRNFLCPYYEGTSVCAQIFGMVKHEGVYYAAVRSTEQSDGSYLGGGIYVSADGEHWACAYRVEALSGFRNIVGFANGYLWGTFYDDRRRLFKMAPVQADVVKAMRVERGVTNQLDSPESSSFEGGDGGWGLNTTWEDINAELTGPSTDMALHGTSSYKIVCQDNGRGQGSVVSGFCPVNPVLGDYICASFWIKGAPTWPDRYSWLGYIRIEAVNGGYIYSEWGNFNVTQEWCKHTVWGRCTSVNFTDGVRIRLTMLDWALGYPGDFSDATCYVDGAQVVYFNDLHYSGPWQIGGIPRANEVAAGSLVGLGAEFTTTFEWKPERSRREWHDNIYIANFADRQEYIDLYYDHNSSKFVATDGVNTAVTNGTFSWEHTDSIKLALTNMDNDFRLSIVTPLDGVEHVLTDNGDTKLGAPLAVVFGTDSMRTNYCSGLIANVQHLDSALSVSEVQKIFDMTKDYVEW